MHRTIRLQWRPMRFVTWRRSSLIWGRRRLQRDFCLHATHFCHDITTAHFCSHHIRSYRSTTRRIFVFTSNSDGRRRYNCKRSEAILNEDTSMHFVLQETNGNFSLRCGPPDNPGQLVWQTGFDDGLVGLHRSFLLYDHLITWKVTPPSNIKDDHEEE
jgi:hypothetical protein